MPKKAVVLLSGGLDSATVLAIAKDEGFGPTRSASATGSATRLNSRPRRASPRRSASRQHVVANIDLRMFGGSALTDAIDVPKQRSDAEMADGHPGHLRAGAEHRLSLVRARLGRGARGRGHLHRRQRTRLQRLSRLSARVHPRLRADGEPGHQGRRRGHAATPHPRAADRPHQGADHPARRRARRRLRPHAQLLRPGRRRPRVRHVRLLRAAAQGLS